MAAAPIEDKGEGEGDGDHVAEHGEGESGESELGDGEGEYGVASDGECDDDFENESEVPAEHGDGEAEGDGESDVPAEHGDGDGESEHGDGDGETDVAEHGESEHGDGDGEGEDDDPDMDDMDVVGVGSLFNQTLDILGLEVEPRSLIKEELLGRACSELMHPDKPASVDEIVDLLLFAPPPPVNSIKQTKKGLGGCKGKKGGFKCKKGGKKKGCKGKKGGKKKTAGFKCKHKGKKTDKKKGKEKVGAAGAAAPAHDAPMKLLSPDTLAKLAAAEMPLAAYPSHDLGVKKNHTIRAPNSAARIEVQLEGKLFRVKAVATGCLGIVVVEGR